jgi:hypothetical protein
VRRLNYVAVAAAAALLANPVNLYAYPVEQHSRLLQQSRALVARYGHRLGDANVHPAELDRRSRQRRRARQTHPGKRQ